MMMGAPVARPGLDFEAMLRIRQVRAERRRMADERPSLIVRKAEEPKISQKRKMESLIRENSSPTSVSDGPQNFKKLKMINVKVSIVFMDGRILKVVFFRYNSDELYPIF
jgi:hypothetical protein